MRTLHDTVAILAVVLTAGSSIALSNLEAGENWTSFQNGGRVSWETAAGTDAIALDEDALWTAEVPGYGQSSPVVWDGLVYVTSVTGTNKETYHITAFQLEDGAKAWDVELSNATPQENSNYVSKAAPTPAVDDAGVICFFEGGNLIALTHDGEIRWERNLVTDYGSVESRHGLSASLEQNVHSVFVWVERAEDPYLLSVDKKTGETNWKVAGAGATSWASPRLVPVNDGHHLVLSAIGSLVGIDPQTGERLWRIDDVTGNSTPTPVPVGQGRFLIGATVGRGESGGGKAAESNGLVQIEKADDGSWQAHYVWRAQRATSSFGSPIAHQGLAYFINRSGVLYGLNLETGEEQFAERLPSSAWATPMGVGSQLYVFGKDGQVSIITRQGESPNIATWGSLPADPKPAEQAEGPFSGSVLYAATWSGDLILMRRGDLLFAIRAVPQPAVDNQ